MFKKIATGAATAALVLSVATPAFASVHQRANVRTHVDNTANSGGNLIQGFVVAGGSIETGNATANSVVVNDVNSAQTGHHSNTSVRQNARVRVNVDNTSNSGGNVVQGGLVLGGSVDSGNAGANSGVVNVVNSTTTSH